MPTAMNTIEAYFVNEQLHRGMAIAIESFFYFWTRFFNLIFDLDPVYPRVLI